jgi:uncharacterized membrane protein YtjA (UPF0391 family)
LVASTREHRGPRNNFPLAAFWDLGGLYMLGWALTFFVLSLVAAYLGFFSLVGPAALAAKVFLGVFLVLLGLSAVMGALRRRPPG